MTSDDSANLLKNWLDGSDEAAAAMFHRYVEQLIALARSKLSARIQRRVDPEDVVQSAYRSFFARAGDGRYRIEQSGGLWSLLAAITLSKVRKHVEFNTAKKRNVADEASIGDAAISGELAAPGPEPSDVVCAVEELERLMVDLAPVHRRILELRLQDYSVEEISRDVQRSDRTVRRVLRHLRAELDSRLADVSAA